MSAADYYLDPDLYDIVYSDFVADIAPHVALVRGARAPALEVCCGNGRLLIPTLEAGLACDGLDWDEKMLASLREKLAARSLSATVLKADMRDFSLPSRYALILIPFNSLCAAWCRKNPRRGSQSSSCTRCLSAAARSA